MVYLRQAAAKTAAYKRASTKPVWKRPPRRSINFVNYPDESLTFSTILKEKERVMRKNYFFANLGQILIVISARVHP